MDTASLNNQAVEYSVTGRLNSAIFFNKSYRLQSIDLDYGIHTM